MCIEDNAGNCLFKFSNMDEPTKLNKLVSFMPFLPMIKRMKQNDLDHFHLKCVDYKNPLPYAEINHAVYFDCQKTPLHQKSKLFHLIQLLQTEKKKRKQFSSRFITAQSENQMRPELTSGMQIRNF